MKFASVSSIHVVKTYITPFYLVIFYKTQQGGLTQLRRWAKLWWVGWGNKLGGVGRRCAKKLFKTCLRNKYLIAFLVVVLGQKVHYGTRYLLWQGRLRKFKKCWFNIHFFYKYIVFSIEARYS